MGGCRRVLIVLLSITLLGATGGGQDFVSFPSVGGVPLDGNLYRPEGAGPFPAMVLLHGCSGVIRNVHSWAGWLRGQGYVAVVVDSFTPRRVMSVCGRRSSPEPRERALDALGAEKYLQTIPFIDGNRIGVMGWSHGARTNLEAIRIATHGFRAAVALYPGCRRFAPPAEVPPLLLLLGEADNWTPSKPCVELAESLRSAGQPVLFTVYPGAHHGFDNADVGAEGRWVREAGATVRYDPAAAAHQRVRAFLAEHLAGP